MVQLGWGGQLGLVVRGLATGHVPPQPFILVSLGSLFFLMVGWRTVFTLVFPNDDGSLQKRTGNRQGGVFEFFEVQLFPWILCSISFQGM